MKRSGDLVLGKSGDRKGKRITETRRRGEERRKVFSDHPITRDLPMSRSFPSVSPCLRGEILQLLFSAPPRLRGELAFSITRLPDHPITRSLNPCHPERHGATQERGKVEGSRVSVPYWSEPLK